MPLPSPSRSVWLAVAALALFGVALVAFVPWRGAPSLPTPLHHGAKAPDKASPKAPPRAKKVQPPPSAYALEQQMTPRELLRRWDPLIADA